MAFLNSAWALLAIVGLLAVMVGTGMIRRGHETRLGRGALGRHHTALPLAKLAQAMALRT